MNLMLLLGHDDELIYQFDVISNVGIHSSFCSAASFQTTVALQP